MSHAPQQTASTIIQPKDSIQYRFRSYFKRTRQTTMFQMQSNNKFYLWCQRIPYSRTMPALSVCGCYLLQMQMRNGALNGSWPRLQMPVDRFRSGCRGVGQWVECQRPLWRMWVCFWVGLRRKDPPKSYFDTSIFIPSYFDTPVLLYHKSTDSVQPHKQRTPGPTLPVSKISTSPAPSASSSIQRNAIPLNSFHFFVLPGSTPLNSPLIRFATLKLRLDSTAPSQRSRRRVNGASWYLDCFNKASK